MSEKKVNFIYWLLPTILSIIALVYTKKNYDAEKPRILIDALMDKTYISIDTSFVTIKDEIEFGEMDTVFIGNDEYLVSDQWSFVDDSTSNKSKPVIIFTDSIQSSEIELENKVLNEMGYTISDVNSARHNIQKNERIVNNYRDGEKYFTNSIAYELYGEKIVFLQKDILDSTVYYSLIKPERIVFDSLCVESKSIGKSSKTYTFPQGEVMYSKPNFIGLSPDIDRIKIYDRSSWWVKGDHRWHPPDDANSAWTRFPYRFHFWSTENQVYEIAIALYWHDALNNDKEITLLSERIKLEFPIIESYRNLLLGAKKSVKFFTSSPDGTSSMNAIRYYRSPKTNNRLLNPENIGYGLKNKEMQEKYPIDFDFEVIWATNNGRNSFHWLEIDSLTKSYSIEKKFNVKLVTPKAFKMDFMIIDDKKVLVRRHQAGNLYDRNGYYSRISYTERSADIKYYLRLWKKLEKE